MALRDSVCVVIGGGGWRITTSPSSPPMWPPPAGVAAGEGCSAGGGCATCPYMKMNSLDALLPTGPAHACRPSNASAKGGGGGGGRAKGGGLVCWGPSARRPCEGLQRHTAPVERWLVPEPKPPAAHREHADSHRCLPNPLGLGRKAPEHSPSAIPSAAPPLLVRAPCPRRCAVPLGRGRRRPSPPCTRAPTPSASGAAPREGGGRPTGRASAEFSRPWTQTDRLWFCRHPCLFSHDFF